MPFVTVDDTTTLPGPPWTEQRGDANTSRLVTRAPAPGVCQ